MLWTSAFKDWTRDKGRSCKPPQQSMFALAQTCMASPDVYEENTYLNTLHSQNSKEDSPVLYHSNNTANSDGPQKQTPGKYPPSLVGSSQVIKLLGEGQLTLV